MAGTLLGCLGLVWGPRALLVSTFALRGSSAAAGVGVLESAGFLKGGGEPVPGVPGGPGFLVLAQLAGWELTVWVLGWDIAPRTERLRKGLPVGRGGKVGASGAAVGSGGPGGLLRAPREPPPSALTPSLLCPLKLQLEAGRGGLASHQHRPLVSLGRLVQSWSLRLRKPYFQPGACDFPGESDGSPLQYSSLENPKDGGAYWAIVHGVAKSWTWLSNFTFFLSL